MSTRAAVLGFAAALALAAPTGYALQAFTLDEARTRIERLEARVAALEDAAGNDASASAPAGRTTQTIEGSVTLRDESASYKVGAHCGGLGGYSDIQEGADVEVLDAEGVLIGLGGLRDSEGISATTCRLHFTVENVPATDFYEFEVSGRGGPTFSHKELEADGWTVDMAIGD